MSSGRNQPARNMKCEKAQKAQEPSRQQDDRENGKHAVRTVFHLLFASVMPQVTAPGSLFVAGRLPALALSSPAGISPASAADQEQHQQNNQQGFHAAPRRERRRPNSSKPQLSYSSQATSIIIINATDVSVCSIATRCLSICAHILRG
jgi:hypothetical protein